VEVEETRKNSWVIQKPCKYFLKGNACPFSDVGCKFLHDDKEDDEEI
jgi:hypothetical protein